MTVTPGGVPNDFYITQTSAQDALSALADGIALEMVEKTLEAEICKPLCVGNACLVENTETSLWLRGQIEEVTDAGVKVKQILKLVLCFMC